MLYLIKLYVVSLLVFLLVDMLWLGVIAKKLYSDKLGYLMAPQINWLAAFLFYILFIAGLVFFVLHPAIKQQSWSYAIYAGLLFGFICYATYDLTNLATIKDWPLSVTIIDLIWGAFISAFTAGASYLILTKWL